MTIEAKITTNAEDVAKAFKDLQRRQLPFATARGLTILANDAKKAEAARMPQVFKIRSKRVPKGIRTKAAKKSDWPHNQKSVVGTLDDFMVQHETGKTKRPIKSRNLAIPGRKANVRTKTGKVKKSKKPRTLLGPTKVKKKPFVVTFKSGKKAIVRRQKKKRLPLLTLYIFETKARISKRWKFRSSVKSLVQMRYEATMKRTLTDAVRTAKRKANLKATAKG